MGNNIKEESGLKFQFPENDTVIKFDDTKECVDELKEYVQFLSNDTFSNDSKKKYVILFLEGDFGGRTRTKKMIMKTLQDSMNKKLKWINCRVSVVDSDTYDSRLFQIVS